jgi:uncharacterized delta-60 repeat protein
MKTRITFSTRWLSPYSALAWVAVGVGLLACSAEFKTRCPEGTVQTGGGDVDEVCKPSDMSAGGAGMAGGSASAGGGAPGSGGSGAGGAAGQMGAPLPGSLDATFGQEGRVRVPILFEGKSIFSLEIRGAKLQSSGKLVIAGTATFNGTYQRPFLARLDESGNLDASFGGGSGYVVLPISPLPALTYGIEAFEVMPDDKIIAVGYVDSPYEEDYATQLARFNANGTPDDTFEAAAVEPALDKYTILRTAGDKLLVTGNHKAANDIYLPPTHFYAFRFDASGQKDDSFVPVELKDQNGGLSDRGAVAVDASGRFVVAMLQRSADFMPGKFAAVARLSPTGLLDTSFGGQGTGYHFENFGTGRLGGIAVDGKGNLIVAGSIHESQRQGALVRFAPDGSLVDGSFGTSGVVSGAPVGDDVDTWSCLVVLPNDKIVAAGHRTERQGNIDFYTPIAARFMPNGAFDAQYGGRGTGSVLLGEGTAVDTCLLDHSGRALVVGHSLLNGSVGMDVIRILN